MPGSPLDTLAGSGRLRDAAQREAVIARYGLDKDVFTRYGYYIVNLLTFNFGISYTDDIPVGGQILARLSNTLTLIGLSLVLAISVGTILGVYSASRRGGVFDSAQVTSSLVWSSLPTFWMGLVGILIFFVYLHWPFPPGDSPAHSVPDAWATNPPNLATLSGLGEFFAGHLRHLFLPVMVLFLFQYGGFLLLTRATMTEALTDDYVTTARAKGLKERTVLFRHALKNASLPIITSISLSIGFILGGAIITETVFSWNGMGYWIYQAINQNDYPVMQAIFYIIALMVIFANFFSDILLGMVDPRIKYG